MKIFPRTPHLAWSGYMTPDDERLSDAASREFLNEATVVQEKLDGANVSIRIESGSLILENRGKPISRHPQFDLFKRWAAERRTSLDSLGDNILFGEFLFCEHGTRYDELPDWFIAYDVWVPTIGDFLAQGEVAEICRDLGLTHNRLLEWPAIRTPNTLRMLASDRSVFATNTAREGLYLRLERDNRCTGRAKLVRPGYRPRSDEDWARRGVVPNVLKRKPLP